VTKEEIVKIVDRVCSAWNQNLVMSAKKEMYETWYHVLQDIDGVNVLRVIDDLIIEDERFMPRVGTVRKRVLIQKIEAPLEPIIAWQQFRSIADSAGAGVEILDMHPLVRVTLNRLGGTSAFGLHTNGDRESFLSVYRLVVAEWEREHYGINRGR